MAAPAYKSQGTAAGGTTGVSPTYPATVDADDIAILVVEHANEPISAAAIGDGTWSNVDKDGNTLSTGAGTAGAVGSTGGQLFWKRLAGTEDGASVSVPDAGDHTLARIYTFSGCITSGNPIGASAKSSTTTAGTSYAIPGLTTPNADNLVVGLAFRGNDSGSTLAFSGQANADLTGVTRPNQEAGTTSGNGGGFGIVYGTKATAGAVGAWTLTGPSAEQSLISIALLSIAISGSTGLTVAGATSAGTTDNATLTPKTPLTLAAANSAGIANNLTLAPKTALGLAAAVSPATVQNIGFSTGLVVASASSKTFVIGGFPGIELVTNGSFNGSPGANWATGGNTIFSAGLAVINAAGASDELTQGVTLPAVGRLLKVTYTIVNTGGGSLQAKLISTAGIDPSIYVPVLSLLVANDVFPPQLEADMSTPYVQAGVHSFQLQGDGDIDFGSPFLDVTVPITDSVIDNEEAIVAALNSILAGTTFFRARLHTSTAHGAWSGLIGHGDTTDPLIISTANYSLSERSPVLLTIQADELCYFQVTGIDSLFFEKVGAEPATSIQLRLAGNADLDYETKSSYSFGIIATDIFGNSSGDVAHSITVLDIDEVPDAFTFTDVSNAAASTLYTSNTITVAGLAAGVSVPVTVTGGEARKNGGTWGPGPFSAVNTDQFQVRHTSGSGSAASTHTILSVNGITDTFTTTTVNTFNPASIFAGGDLGFILDPADDAVNWSDTAATDPAAIGELVRRIDNKHTSGQDWAVATSGPTRVNNGGPAYEFNGINNYIEQSQADLYNAGASTLIFAVKSLNTAQTTKTLFCEANTADSDTKWRPHTDIGDGAGQRRIWIVSDAGVSMINAASSTVAWPDGAWNLVMIEDTGTHVKIEKTVNGVASNNGTGSAYTRAGNTLTLDRTVLGSALAGGTRSGFFNGLVGRVVGIDRLLTAQEKLDIKTWIAGNNGIQMP